MEDKTIIATNHQILTSRRLGIRIAKTIPRQVPINPTSLKSIQLSILILWSAHLNRLIFFTSLLVTFILFYKNLLK